MVLLYLNQSAHIIDQIRESDVECSPNYPDPSEKQPLHALFHETVNMFDAAARLRLDFIVFLLFIRKRIVPVCPLYYQRCQTSGLHRFFRTGIRRVEPAEFSFLMLAIYKNANRCRIVNACRGYHEVLDYLCLCYNYSMVLISVIVYAAFLRPACVNVLVISSGTSSTLWMSRNSLKLILSFI